jgi:hypothetical protein
LPEAGRHAPILIAISWQGLHRAIREGQQSLLCNCTVVILFAGFYLEANLNYIVDHLHMTGQMNAFLHHPHPGLQDKLGWFYNEFVARSKAVNRGELYSSGITEKIRRRFPGFAKLYRFRNDISHGVINRSARSLSEAQRLRQQAKDIVNELFEIVRERGRDIPRATTYYQAINQ